jgi:hypothetical protein
MVGDAEGDRGDERFLADEPGGQIILSGGVDRDFSGFEGGV